MEKTKVAIAVVSILALSACGSDDKPSVHELLTGGSTAPAPAPEPEPEPEPSNSLPQAESVALDVYHGGMYRGVLSATDADEDELTFEIDSSSAENGEVTLVDKKTGEFTYKPVTPSTQDVITYTVTDGTDTVEATITIDISAGDPLHEHQWHLTNTGQNVFSITRGTPGMDLNLQNTIAEGIHGESVTVAVVDDGVEISHPDLQNNIVVNGSYNLVDGSIDPTPFNSVTSAHGTAVAGLIAAEGFNGIGGRGVAPKAKLKGFNYLQEQSQESFMIAHGVSAYSDDAQVINQSYGRSPMDFSAVPSETDKNGVKVYDKTDEDKLLHEVTKSNNNGKGVVFVKAAGNEALYYQGSYMNDELYASGYILPVGFFDNQEAGKASNDGIPVHNPNLASYNSNGINLTVSALDADGFNASYSSFGSNIFVAAPAGEDGFNKPAMLTTDRAGCDKGWNQSATPSKEDKLPSPFYGGNHPLDVSCDYTDAMAGTSSAAPNTSGAVALIMDANPNLSWRDVKAILAKTSTKVYPDIEPVSIVVNEKTKNAPEEKFEAIAGWTENAAGYTFHNRFGFGLVNVDEAVKMAKSYETYLPEMIESAWKMTADEPVAVEDADLAGGVQTIEIADDVVVESAHIIVNLEHGRHPDLAIELESPAGTKSLLLPPKTHIVKQGLGGDDKITDATLMSNAFFGESAKGTWKLRVVDTNKGEFAFSFYGMTYNFVTGDFHQSASLEDIAMPNNTKPGELTNWSLKFHGHSKGEK